MGGVIQAQAPGYRVVLENILPIGFEAGNGGSGESSWAKGLSARTRRD